MKNVNVRKLALAGILVAVGIVCSPLSIPVGCIKVRSGPAFYQHPWRCVSGTGLCSGHGICDEPSQKPDGDGNPSCFSGFHVRSISLRYAV